MLDADTKRRIDTARDILVGKVPDPKSQVEQITIALIYKFMDDMDAESEELGGARKFFTGEFVRYGWAKLMRSGLGGHETLNLYAEAIDRMPENPGIPLLFRNIFQNAYLPYRDPETLRAFLKVIDEFSYDHSERLGDAFEYLLSVLGSQGDAGQFRTPRHIIDFIVAVIDPKKDEAVLDPACGTAGFLISSYKHILAANTGNDGSTLTPEERGRLAANFKGYDISPDMVRLSLVNMYLHGFVDPHIFEYDTLTSDERWNERADVILANPPFMSPKGGIRPHNRFSVQSKRSEVLFVDYMAEHLTPAGRAGIIVPEGVIFQSQNAHTQLRKMLVEEYLVAVVSLPAGVFKPYSGVKTSILILDKALARRTDRIAFFKVENDGFDLGDQRRPIAKDDLPQAQADIGEYLRRARAGESMDGFELTMGLVVEKSKIAANGDYNLSGERYREGSFYSAEWPLVELKEIAQEIKAGFACGRGTLEGGAIPHIRPMNVTEHGQFTWNGVKRISKEDYLGRQDYELLPGDVLFNNTNSKELVGKTCIIKKRVNGGYSNHMTRIRVSEDQCDSGFLAYILHAAWRRGDFLERANKWIGQAGINTKSLGEFLIPLPPLEVQQEIVAEIVGYQRVIDGARAVVDNYRPRVAVDPAWPLVALGEVVDVLDYMRKPITKHDREPGPYPYYGATGILDYVADYLFDEPLVLVGEDGAKWGSGESTAYSIMGRTWVNNHAHVLRPDRGSVLDRFLVTMLVQSDLSPFITGVTVPKLNQARLRAIPLPLPPMDVQQAIVAELEAEQALVEANRQLIERFEKKIESIVARVWGEDERSATGSSAAG